MNKVKEDADSEKTHINALRRHLIELEKQELENQAIENMIPDSEQYHSALFEYNPIETIVVDLEGHITAFNRAKRHSGGRLPKIGDVMYRDYASKHEKDMHGDLLECIKTNQSRNYPALKYNDEYLHITIAPFPNGAIIISQNVTESKIAEEALKKSEERYRGLFDGVPVGIYRAKPNGQIMEANQALVQILGFPNREMLVSMNLVDLYDDLNAFIGVQDILKKKDFIRDFEVQISRLNGNLIWVRTSAKAVLNDSGSVQYFEGMVEDITERKQTGEALKKSEQEKDLILGSLMELVSYQDAKHRIIWTNRAISESFGLSRKNLVGKYCYDVWQKRSEPCPGCPMAKIIRTGRPQQTESTTPDGRIWSKRGYPVLNNEGEVTGIVEVALDITHQKKIETEKEKIQEQLLQSQKMEAVGTLAGGIAHDFNNLLTAIHGCVDLALVRAGHDEILQKDLNEIRSAAVRAADLTRQLLLFSRKHLSRFTPLSLNQTIDGLLKMLHRLIGEDILIATSLEPDLWTVKADQGTIEQILLNLAINARDAMPTGGKLIIRTENVILDELYCKLVSDARPGHFVLLTMADTGIGMNRETIQHIFEPFFSTKSPGKGTGLGLSVVYGIIKQHDGWVNVYSEPGKGSEFKLYFPAVFTEPFDSPKMPVSSSEDLQGTGEHVLIVEDEDCVREFCRRALEKNGYIVSAVSSVEQAIKLFHKEKGRFDLIFSDVVLPDNSGLDLIQTLKEHKKDLNFLLTSGYTDTKSQWKTISEQGYRFLQKPYALVDLLRAIKTGVKTI